MRRTLIPAALLVALAAGLVGAAAETPPSKEPAVKPANPARRVPWDTSRVVGSPNPPPPYRVVRTFTKLKIPAW
jgi:hypothetical protein